MKKMSLSFVLLIFFFCKPCRLQAQIALSYSDTTVCPEMPLQMCASLTGLIDALDNDDPFSEKIDIGFPFTYFGNVYTKCVASGNGMISFDTALAGNLYGWTWGVISAPTAAGTIVANNSIFATFVDMNPDAAPGLQIRHQVIGIPGQRRFIIEWCHNPIYGCITTLVTSQLILYEGSNIIEVHTTDLPPISSGCPAASLGYYRQVVQGVRNENGSIQFFPVNRDPVVSINNWGVTGAVNDGMRFSPNGTTAYDIDTIAFNPWVILDSVNSSNLKWYEEGQTNLPIGTGSCVSVVTNPNINYYTVNYTGLAGCQNYPVDFTDTVFIHFGTTYDTTNAEICAGTTYNWLGRTLFTSGNYDTVFHSQMGCDSFLRLHLVVNPLPDVTMKGNPHVGICATDSVVLGIAGAENNVTYQWYKDGATITGATNFRYVVHEAGKYKLIATTNKGCQRTSQEFTVVVNPNPVATILPLSNDISCAYDTVQLVANAGPSYDYVWSPAKPFRAVSGPEGQKVQGIFIDLSTEVMLTVYNQYGCYDSDITTVLVKPCCEVFTPNAFTPNGDGLNDYFNPALQPGQTLLAFKVYDRYGHLIYDNDNLKKGWNGLYKDGSEVSSGVYMYYIRYTCADGKLYDRKESVTLLK